MGFPSKSFGHPFGACCLQSPAPGVFGTRQPCSTVQMAMPQMAIFKETARPQRSPILKKNKTKRRRKSIGIGLCCSARFEDEFVARSRSECVHHDVESGWCDRSDFF